MGVSFEKQTGYHADYYRMTGTVYKKSVRSYVKRKLFHNLNFMYWYRKYQKNKSIIARFFIYRLSRKYGLEISVNAKIGDGLYLGHPYNITVGEDVTIGNNVNLHKGCTIGRTIEREGCKNAGSPKIGNTVFVGINAVIVGDITIGDDVLIAPNSYVNFDVPSHSVVLGNPAKIHARENAVENYIVFCV